MRLNPAHLEHARQVADAVLYEGYLLYPYRPSSQKNQVRFQFGVLMPPGYAQLDPHEGASAQTECLLECPDETQVRVLVRFLHLQQRVVQGVSPETGDLEDVGTLYVDGTEYTSWQEAAEREQQVTIAVSALLAKDKNLEFHLGPGESAEDITDVSGRMAGRLIRRWTGLDGVIRLHTERVAGPYRALRLRVRVENTATPQIELRSRADGLAHALIAAHALIGAPGGQFLSMTDPPEWAAAEIAACQNIGTWPVLAGPQDCRDLVLSSPVILYDHPEVAPESAGDLFDATEIDEILTLRTMALTDAEKREARAGDSRVAEMLDRLDDLPPEMLERMHGAIRYLRSAPAGAGLAQRPVAAGLVPEPRDEVPTFGMPTGPDWPGGPGGSAAGDPAVPWWDPGADTSVSPQTDHVLIDGVRVARDSRVRLRPGSRRADAQDFFLAGREAVVEAVLYDVDGRVHLAVTVADDPAADLQRDQGRFLYFAPDEVEPLAPGT
ncbi:MAG TPA: hypothetical protein VGG25_20850 [Streptosporangiaceae bacterium]|jgi:hypothetical protein